MQTHLAKTGSQQAKERLSLCRQGTWLTLRVSSLWMSEDSKNWEASMYLALSVKVTLRLRSKYAGYPSNKCIVQDGHLRKAGERCDGVSFPTGLCPRHGRCCTAGITAAYPVRAAPLSLMSNLTPYVQRNSCYSTDTFPKII